MDLKITPSGQTIVKPTALGPVANTDTKLLIYGLFQKGRILAQDGELKSANREMSRSAREEFHSTARMAFRPAGQKSPLSDLGARMSGSSFRTLYTLVLTARFSRNIVERISI